MAATSSSTSSLPIQRLLGKVALVTGGAGGIGLSIVRLFHKHGAKVCVADIQDDIGQNLCKTLGDNTSVSFCHCDVTLEDIRNFDLSVFEKVFDVNVKGVFLGMKHAARIMIPAKKGSIISMCSVACTIGGLGPHAYTGSKHAVLGLTRNVAAELGKHGIRVNCISPYAVATSLALAHLPEDERTEVAMIGFHDFVGRNANLQGVELTADDVANAVVFLASDEARYISGSNLMVDGGFTSANHSLRVFSITSSNYCNRFYFIISLNSMMISFYTWENALLVAMDGLENLRGDYKFQSEGSSWAFGQLVELSLDFGVKANDEVS
ncbi:unnamed protein product [Fraxinus pennsylvanica]|uniref:Xanthoxin dehydrogenase n=1 Tax=Fraxinus pennsylvanica TaxID=56036 RepID=A0AAD1ZHJ6_9LAMI|nr:unnamed protein product [Fraxinus pennsylvanica]